jgi:hypothetical protein
MFFHSRYRLNRSRGVWRVNEIPVIADYCLGRFYAAHLLQEQAKQSIALNWHEDVSSPP